MPGNAIISVSGVSKAYRMWESPASRLTVPIMEGLAAVMPGAQRLNQRAASRYRDFWALKDISFEVGRGEAVGIIGRNGSGKSTLLQLIVGTLQPTTGTVQVQGRIGALLELGSGFNPDFTGRENVHLNAAVLGLSRAEIDARFADIAAFADIGDFIDQPVKTYSSGMMVRLAFAVQTAVEPDILIIDEALGVGDFFFQQKCAARMRELRERGTTLLFVSHDMASVRDLCERALYLRKGRAEFWGESQDAIARYYGEGSDAPPVATADLSAPAARFADFQHTNFRAIAHWWHENQPNPEAKPEDPLELLGVAFVDPRGRASDRATMGHEHIFRVLYRARVAGDYHVAIELKNRYDQVLTSCGSYTCGLPARHLEAGESVVFEMALQLNFEAGRYTCQVVLGRHGDQANRGQRVAVSPWLGPIEITWDYEGTRAPFLGLFGPPARARFL